MSSTFFCHSTTDAYIKTHAQKAKDPDQEGLNWVMLGRCDAQDYWVQLLFCANHNLRSRFINGSKPVKSMKKIVAPETSVKGNHDRQSSQKLGASLGNGKLNVTYDRSFKFDMEPSFFSSTQSRDHVC